MNVPAIQNIPAKVWPGVQVPDPGPNSSLNADATRAWLRYRAVSPLSSYR